MVQGIANTILRVDLSSGRIWVDEPDERFYRTYLGGAGFVSYFLLTEVPRGIDAFSPENRLIFAVGPMTGLAMPGATRNCVGAKSPLTNGYAKSEVGGFWPMEVKKAGYDAIIVEGKAEKPVYLLVTDETVELRDASALWGKTALETEDMIIAETGIKRLRTAAIGPAGEHLVRFACIMNNRKDAAGRGGLGAVMGSKHLKAIAAFGRKSPQVADPARIRELTLAMNRNFYDLPLFNKALHDVGTGEHASMLGGNAVGNMPSYNFGVNAFAGTAKITATTTMETYGVGMEGCAACAVRCKKVVELGEPWHVNRRNGGPEYESLASLGVTCGIDNLAAICKASELANLYGIDTISLGVSIAFGMDCFENGLLSLADTDGMGLRFGDAEGMLRLVDMITTREGVGNLLAEGVHRASQKIGKGAEALAVHVKGVEVPMHDPRVKQGMGIVYAVEAHGADHCAGLHDTLFTQESAGFEHLRGLDATRPLPAHDLSADKVANVKAAHLWALFRDSLVCCQFVPWTIAQHVDIVRAVTGWSYTTYEALKLGERIATMGRIFNLREGLTAAQDTLPKRLFNPTRAGALRTGGIDREKMQHVIQTFYGMMGWDAKTGIPTPEKLAELRLDWAEEDIAALRDV